MKADLIKFCNDWKVTVGEQSVNSGVRLLIHTKNPNEGYISGEVLVNDHPDCCGQSIISSALVTDEDDECDGFGYVPSKRNMFRLLLLYACIHARWGNNVSSVIYTAAGYQTHIKAALRELGFKEVQSVKNKKSGNIIKTFIAATSKIKITEADREMLGVRRNSY